MTVAEMIMYIDNKTRRVYGVTSRPDDQTWERMLKDMTQEITTTPGLLENLRAADLETLTCNNYHTARQAAEMAMNLYKDLSLKAET